MAQTETGLRTGTWDSVGVGTLPQGGELEIPYWSLGSGAGPTLVVLATQHGNEYATISVLRELIASLERRADDVGVSGRLIIVPVANPLAFAANIRSTPVDALYADQANLNRVWPGNPDGFLTERIADALWTEFVGSADFVLDIHTKVHEIIAICYTYLLGDATEQAALRPAALSLGTEILVSRMSVTGARLDGTVTSARSAAGLPGLCLELGDFTGPLGAVGFGPAQAEPTRSLNEVGLTAIRNLMVHLGLVTGELRLPPMQVIVTPEQKVSPNAGGLLFPQARSHDIGRIVDQGATLGRVIDPLHFGVLEEIRPPFEESLIIAVNDCEPCTPIAPGGFCYFVSDWGTAERVENAETAVSIEGGNE